MPGVTVTGSVQMRKIEVKHAIGASGHPEDPGNSMHRPDVSF